MNLEIISRKVYNDNQEGIDTLYSFVSATIDAFFNNDLLFCLRHFVKYSKGSFGVSFMSLLDAPNQVCYAAKGQTMSIAFYPNEGIICYGSEQAAVEAGLNYSKPGKPLSGIATRLDLDDLMGEIILLDWNKGVRFIYILSSLVVYSILLPSYFLFVSFVRILSFHFRVENTRPTK
ncbi:MAG: hypothetical protein ACI8RD_008600 [Bacillariaceae sp.]|jgi:hypothetical protein